ncbi:hypothetical protein VTO42DRAFT_3296 [Malbranchea cinnamomea]
MARKKTWDDAAHAKLLLEIIKEVKLSAAQYDKIAERLGEGLTGNAIQCHVKWLRKATGAVSDPNSVPSTPKKSVKENTASAENTPKTSASKRSLPPRKRNKPIIESDEESDNSVEFQATPPAKRVKRESLPVMNEDEVHAENHVDETA